MKTFKHRSNDYVEKLKYGLFVLAVMTIIMAVTGQCSEPEDECVRTGAKCKDGNTVTTDTGPDACRDHGGVDYWLCQ